MSYRKRSNQQYGLYRVKFRYKGKTEFTQPFPTRREAEAWARKWRTAPRPAEYRGDSVAQVVSDVEPVRIVTPGYVKQWNVRSDRDSSITYIISLKRDGTYECSCPQNSV